MIITGALVATVIVFFIFFKSSGPKTDIQPELSSTRGSSTSFIELEKRLETIESSLKRLSADGSDSLPGTAEPSGEFALLQQKVQRLETSVLLKLDSLIERMGKMEKKIRILSKKSRAVQPKVKASAPKTSRKTPTKAPTNKAPTKTLAKKSAAKPVKKAPMFHTVQKGETLWSISRKYKTSVAALRKLNKLSPEIKIYPGTNILVR